MISLSKSLTTGETGRKSTGESKTWKSVSGTSLVLLSTSGGAEQCRGCSLDAFRLYLEWARVTGESSLHCVQPLNARAQADCYFSTAHDQANSDYVG